MLARALFLFLVGGAGGLLAFLIMEPFVPPVRDPGMIDDVTRGAAMAWVRFTLSFGIVGGICIGAALGLVSGYYQGSRAHVLRGAMFGAGLGFLGGLIGVTIGGFVYGILSGGSQVFALGPLIQMIARGLGWALFGGCIGLAEGAMGKSVKRMTHGMIGGLIGGFVGGILFEISALAFSGVAIAFGGGGNPEGTIPRAIGLVSVGAFVGLFIGIVEALARKAWVRVVLGRNEGREYLIDSNQSVLGASEMASVPLFGDPTIAPNHAVIRKESPGYVLYDTGSPAGTYLDGARIQRVPLYSGATIQIGKYKMIFMLREGRAQPMVAAGYGAVSSNLQPINLGPAAQPGAQGLVQQPAPVPVQAVTPWSLVGMDPPHVGQVFPISNTLTIGRESATIPLADDKLVSRQHVRLDVKGHQLEATDLASRNGTFVNDQRIESIDLQPGAILKVGNHRFRVQRN
jgi:pSer/pThr/pTyr-binding forkhead associated (FHA) protein